ncbi:hypothetical protein BJ138DRAFT_1148975 [Hygrophoropsis aurantiaca]|uniref:Uncharacterized protein n=1 Tax=Hygrophoropsis aurantiaca TaxID=72124 RepID=A0ACB8AFV4_9AGAM|nr:hypothetical protein BJ138DRAFT_1148975 [Hygrophoropsis aurantiaca]
MYQARDPKDNTKTPPSHSQAEGSTQPPPPPSGSRSTSEPSQEQWSSLDRADKAVPNAPQTKSGASAYPKAGPRPGPEPTPQRTREDDGRVYTKYVEPKKS